MFSNGVPIGYGGVTPWPNQANTGANLFPAFRGSVELVEFVLVGAPRDRLPVTPRRAVTVGAECDS